MKTEFKEVAHFYLGCQCQDEDGATYTLRPGYFPNNWKDVPSKHKPILRPLSDMTEDEAEKLNCIFPFPVSCRASNEEWRTDEFIYALRQGFDMFDLIESGQAIDATKI